MNDNTMLGRGATAAFATRKPCKHGTVLADLCGLCRQEKEPTMTTKTTSALERLRGFAWECRDNPDLESDLSQIADAFEDEQRQRDLESKNHGDCLRQEALDRTQRDAKIRAVLKEAQWRRELHACSAQTFIDKALALLDGEKR